MKITKKEKHILKSVYRNIRNRCYNTKNLNYLKYGNKGIKICDRWLGDQGFENFVNDMGARPEGPMQIDRIDGTKDYSPDNCRWVNVQQNLMNRSKFKTNKLGFKGVSPSKTKNKYRAAIAFNKVDVVIGTFFNTPEDAAYAYDLASHILFKEYGVRNFPGLELTKLIEINKELFKDRLHKQSKYIQILKNHL
jgi:hypothetical protein